ETNVIVGYLHFRQDGVWKLGFNQDGRFIAFSTLTVVDNYPYQTNFQIWSVEEQERLALLTYTDRDEGMKYITRFDFQTDNTDCPFILGGSELDSFHFTSFIKCWDWENSGD
ncbi:MAG TPA: hypothetical protein PLZ51_12640, partial [Aggregatilineales bacterium]|nr:hypothetical protein [Aggregatilineales bacterium]